jgi:glycosyltransferase involved in cell wall biosynthesis
MTVINVGVNLVPSAGGVAHCVGLFTSAFRNLKYTSEVLSFNRRGKYVPDSELLLSRGRRFVTVPEVPLLNRYYWCPEYFGSLRPLLNAADLLFIHGLFFHPGIRAATYARKLGLPYVVVSHGSLDPWTFSYRRWRKRAWMWQAGNDLLSGAHAVIYSTTAEQQKAQGIVKAAGCVIRWPVEFVPDYDKAAAIGRAQQALGLPLSSRIAMFCGRVHPIKMPLETIQAFLHAAPPHWVLLLIGPPTTEIPQRLIESVCQSTNGRCRYIGPAYGQSLQEYYKAAEALVLFSHKENFSHVTAEALACGVPVVVSTGVDLACDLDRAAVHCSVVACDTSPQSLAQALRTALLRPSEELTAMGQWGRAWVRENLSSTRFETNIATLCASAQDNSRKSDRRSAPATC